MTPTNLGSNSRSKVQKRQSVKEKTRKLNNIKIKKTSVLQEILNKETSHTLYYENKETSHILTENTCKATSGKGLVSRI